MQLGRDGLQAGQDRDREEGDAAPDVGEADRAMPGVPGVAQEVDILPIRPQSLRTQEMGLRTPSKSISQARLLIAVGTIQGNSRPARMNRLKGNAH